MMSLTRLSFCLAVVAASACERISNPETTQQVNFAPTIAEFNHWLANAPTKQQDYDAFVAFLTHEGVEDVLPPWSLLVPDRQYMSPKCPIAAFIIPPRSQWPNVIPTLRLVRDKIVPNVGSVRISSAYRPIAFNSCIGGAPKSAHLTFAAFDLVTVQPMNRQAMFTTLCAVWRSEPPRTRFGLGTYFSTTEPKRNPIGRFHVDTLGKRTWGFDFRSTSSFCLKG
jgi:Peptidase M15